MKIISRRAALSGLTAATTILAAPACAQDGGGASSGLRIRSSDLATDRAGFHTHLLRVGPSPQQFESEPVPAGVEEVTFPSGGLALKAWFGRPPNAAGATPAVVFAHGGFAFGAEDFDMARPYLAAGYAVIVPMVRGENGMPGNYTMFYDEVADVIAAAEYVRGLPNIDASRIFLAGHSVGGTLSMLAAQSSPIFRASAAFSGSPDQILFCQAWTRIVPFDMSNPVELELRSPLAYAASFKAPARLFHAMNEVYGPDTERTAQLARAAGKDVRAQGVAGDHFSAVPAAMQQSIAFFRTQS
ncbi:MAG: alpha/beta fold hydrolase [Terricaulis sp.]